MNKPEAYDQYIKSAQWRNISKLMKEQASHRCAKCGLGSTTLEVHHLTYERFGHERISDLIVLCKVCHEEADKKRVNEREDKRSARRHQNGYDTYMTKKYGEDYFRYHTIYDSEAFDDWLRGKEGEDNYDPFG